MPIDYPFSLHKDCLPQSFIQLLYMPSLHMDFSSQIVLCRDTLVAHWAQMCTVVFWHAPLWAVASPQAEMVLKLLSVMNECECNTWTIHSICSNLIMWRHKGFCSIFLKWPLVNLHCMYGFNKGKNPHNLLTECKARMEERMEKNKTVFFFFVCLFHLNDSMRVY